LGEHQNKVLADIPIINMQHNMEKKNIPIKMKILYDSSHRDFWECSCSVMYQFNWIFFFFTPFCPL